MRVWYIYLTATSDIRTECILRPRLATSYMYELHVRVVGAQIWSSLAHIGLCWDIFGQLLASFGPT